MGTSRVNHVSVSATDLAASTDFYARLLGAEPVATPDFGFPVQWLALEDTQLHIFERDSKPTQHHHLGV
jgi:catechol 2,3-dioxygenase-like lactoylglutathione lyase family enzyme